MGIIFSTSRAGSRTPNPAILLAVLTVSYNTQLMVHTAYCRTDMNKWKQYTSVVMVEDMIEAKLEAQGPDHPKN